MLPVAVTTAATSITVVVVVMVVVVVVVAAAAEAGGRGGAAVAVSVAAGAATAAAQYGLRVLSNVALMDQFSQQTLDSCCGCSCRRGSRSSGKVKGNNGCFMTVGRLAAPRHITPCI